MTDENILDGLLEAQKRLEVEMKEEGTKAFYALLKPIFDEFPDLESVGWYQYTPYFNDGDTCIFKAMVDSPFINGFNEEDEYRWDGEEICVADEEGWFPVWKGSSSESYDDFKKRTVETPEYTWPWKEQARKRVVDSLDKYTAKGYDNPDSIFRLAFGDHVLIMINRDETSFTERFEHD